MLIRAGDTAAAALQHISGAQPLTDGTALNAYTDTFVKSLEVRLPSACNGAR